MSAAPTILGTLAAEAAQRVEASLPAISEAEMTRRAHDASAPLGFPFESGLAGDGLSFICEVKRASPSRGLIAPYFPYLGIASDYAQAGAAAISVLTEPRHFLGSDQCLSEIARTVAIPVLRKDFTVSAYQIYQARVLGASAVLLICAILSDSQLSEYLGLADELGLSCLTEAHDRVEVERAVRAGARVVGVNNRNLHDFTIDRSTSGSLRALVPGDRLFVAESGIRTVDDAVVAARFGADAVLIGESLMTAPDRRGFLRQLVAATRTGPSGTVHHEPSDAARREPPANDSDHPRHAARSRSIDESPRTVPGDPAGTVPRGPLAIKICGVWRDEDVAVLNEVLPQYVGFVFHPGSRRFVDLAAAQRLRGSLDQRISCVGVFLDADVEEVVAVARSGAVQLVQLHGSVSSAVIERVRSGAPEVEIIRSVSVTGPQSIIEAVQLGADHLLLDGPSPGSGEGFDWGLIEQASGLVSLPPLFLAGGLTPANVSATAGLRIAAVDVSSGVESNGVKDPALIRAFADAVRRTVHHDRGRPGFCDCAHNDEGAHAQNGEWASPQTAPGASPQTAAPARTEGQR